MDERAGVLLGVKITSATAHDRIEDDLAGIRPFTYSGSTITSNIWLSPVFTEVRSMDTLVI
jgi:hypothetical protein